MKHWQLFALTIGLPMVVQITEPGRLVSSGSLVSMIFTFPFLMLIYMTFYFGWFYSVGTSLSKKLPYNVRASVGLFRLFTLIPFVYGVFVTGVIGLIFSIIYQERVLGPSISNVMLLVLLHLISMFCMLYCVYFNARALKSVELQRAVTFGDYAAEFFLIWFFPLGIWLIQPRINKLFATHGDR
jgi:hypothetical protein